MLKFQLVSDFHTEFYKNVQQIPEIVPHADYLILAGDIGKPFCEKFFEFLDNTCKKFKIVFYVAGNHEYYSAHKTYIQIKERLEELSRLIANLVYLENNTYNLQVGDQIITIAGTTLWSNVPKVYKNNIEFFIQDYHCIQSKFNRKISVSNTNELHKNSVAWIQNLLQTNPYPIVMITHHAPIINNGECPPQFRGSPLNTAYATDLTNIIKYPIVQWVYGHCHWKNSVVVNKIMVSSNPMGYKGEKTGFESDFTFKVN